MAGSRGCAARIALWRGAELKYPGRWLADQTVASRAALRAEEQRGLGLMVQQGLPPLSAPAPRLGPSANAGGGGPNATPAFVGRVAVVEPLVAFGPPGST